MKQGAIILREHYAMRWIGKDGKSKQLYIMPTSANVLRDSHLESLSIQRFAGVIEITFFVEQPFTYEFDMIDGSNIYPRRSLIFVDECH